jgi:hypothetical protein
MPQHAGAPVAFCSRKLNPAQRNHTTMEKELLSIVETLKEFRTISRGCKALHMHTDHRHKLPGQGQGHLLGFVETRAREHAENSR